MGFLNIHREGRRFLLFCLVFFVGLALLLNHLILHNVLSVVAWVACGVLFLFFFQFFYAPPVRVTMSPSEVYAPATGKIIKIAEVQEPEYFKDKRLLISIFLSPFDPHSSRCPVGGEVAYFKYHPGKFLIAFHPKSSEKNERTSMVIRTANHEILTRQVAGVVARRIKWYIAHGSQVKQGQEYGFIKFGSRMDVFLPLDVDVLVRLKQRVSGGTTSLAKLS